MKKLLFISSLVWVLTLCGVLGQSTLTVNKATGAITGPVSAATFASINSIIVSGGAGGTPSSINLTNGTNLPESGVTNLSTDLAAKAPLASPTFTGTVVFPSGQALIAPALGTPASGSLADSLTYTHDVTAIPNQTGGWQEYFVTGSDATNATASLANITGLVTGTLSNSTKYEIEAVLDCSVSADTNGNKFGISAGGGGTAATVQALMMLNSSSATVVATVAFAAPDTANTNAIMTTSGQTGTAWIHGFVTTRSTGTATISIQHLHVSSGTSTVKVGSIFRIRKAHT